MSSIVENREGGILTLTLNRPETRNALNAALIGDLTDALRRAEDETRVVVLTGAGKAFSAGADLAELQALRSASLAHNRRSSSALGALFGAMRRHPAVIIGRINGHAIAGGCGLLAACDIAIASEQAKLGFTEVRIGFVPAIISALLRHRLSDSRLRRLLLTGELLTAAEAADIDLIDQVVAGEDLDRTVSALSATIVKQTSPAAVALTKRMLAATEGMPAPAAETFLTSFNALARTTKDVERGVGAFLDKREVGW